MSEEDDDDGMSFWIWSCPMSKVPFPASTVPMLGGPLDGESVVLTERGRLPDSVPFPFGGKAYVYDLKIASSNGWTALHYLYTGKKMEVDEE